MSADAWTWLAIACALAAPLSVILIAVCARMNDRAGEIHDEHEEGGI